MKRIPVLFLILLTAACSAPQAVTPSPVPSATWTPAPTGTATSTPTITPTPTPAFPASLTDADQQFLLDHQNDPNVSWEVDAAGVTTVTIHQPLNLTEDELKAAINAECLGKCVSDMGEGENLMIIYGVYTGEITMIIQPNGSTDVVTSEFFLYNGEVKTATMRWLFDVRNPLNKWLYSIEGISGERATIKQIIALFAPGKPASPGFNYKGKPSPEYTEDEAYQKYIAGRYDTPEYYQAIKLWFDSGFDPALAPELVVFGD